MTYYDTLDEDLKRAKEILAKGKPDASLDADIPVVIQLSGGTIFGADLFAAYKLLESFVDHIEHTRPRTVATQLNNFVNALKMCDLCGADPCITEDEPNILCAKCFATLRATLPMLDLHFRNVLGIARAAIAESIHPDRQWKASVLRDVDRLIQEMGDQP